MATFTETFDSHDGTEVTNKGTSSKRRFIVSGLPVVSPGADPDPIAFLQGDADHDTGLGIGADHPNPLIPTLVQSVRIVSRLTAESWLLEVNYGLDDTVRGIVFNGWKVQYSSVTVQFDRLYTIDANPANKKLIGVPAYTDKKPPDANNQTPYFIKRPIPATEAEEGTPCRPSRPGILRTERTLVWKIEGESVQKRTPFPDTINRVQAVLTQNFSVFDFDVASPGNLQYRMGTVNINTFMGAPRGAARFVDWRIDQTEGVDDFNNPEIQFQVTLVFEFDFTRSVDLNDRSLTRITGYNPFQVVHVMTIAEKANNQNVEYVVFDDRHEGNAPSGRPKDARVLENFNISFWTDYNLMLGMFDTSGPRRSLRR